MLLSIVAFLGVFTVVVLVHELGHFLAARTAGVKVYEFSIGFPFSPRMATLFRHRETEFTLRLLPLGGFVSFGGEGDEEARGLFGASPFMRALILSAGSLFNVGFAFLALLALCAFVKDLAFTDALSESARTVGFVLSGTIDLLARIFSGHGSWEGVAGPVGIAAAAGTAAGGGMANLLHFTGMLSLSLGFLNLVPFPALDGGQLLLLLVEALRRKPLDLRTHQVVNAAGMAFFLLLTLLVTYRDIQRIVA